MKIFADGSAKTQRGEKGKAGWPLRRLIHVPIIHGPEDLGEQLEEVRKAYLLRFGVRAWQLHLKGIEQFWREIRERLRPLLEQGRRLLVYQDGLPVCGREIEMARQLSARGGQNYRVLMELVEAGAELVGTEDPELLRREHARARRPQGVSETASAARYDDLMAARDCYIARRIDATLGRTPVPPNVDESVGAARVDTGAGRNLGVLFMGALHRVAEYLPDDIEVVRLGAQRRL